MFCDIIDGTVPAQVVLADEDVVAQALNNRFDNFRLVFDRRFLDTVMARMDGNEAIFKRILDDEEFRGALMDLYADRLYRRLRMA